MFLCEYYEYHQEMVQYWDIYKRSWEWKIVKRNRLNEYIKESRKHLMSSEELLDLIWGREWNLKC